MPASQCFWSALVSMRIRIQRYDDQKLKTFTAKKINVNFFDSELQFTHLYAPNKDVQAKKEAFSP